jgi:hypothetical protein
MFEPVELSTICVPLHSNVGPLALTTGADGVVVVVTEIFDADDVPQLFVDKAV